MLKTGAPVGNRASQRRSKIQPGSRRKRGAPGFDSIRAKIF
jgi:hypothetical protein